jgi:iron complex transport system ATP-binding protein
MRPISLNRQTKKTKTTPSQNQLPLIEYRNVTVIQNRRVVLDGINLSINIGEHVAILGPNGSGKSSLIKTITREYYPMGRHGSYLRILGEEYWNIFELRNLLGIVSNELVEACTRDFSGRQIILSGFFSSIGVWSYQKITPAMEKKVREVMELLEISHLAGRNMSQISTGEARRILIGRALVHNPRALVLDEPTSSLDLHAAYELRKILRKIADARTGIIMVTHSLTDIIPEITRVILLKDRTVFEDDAKEKVLTSKTLSHLFGTQLEVVKRNGYYHLW